MITADIRVNGFRVGHVQAQWKEQTLESAEADICRYEYLVSGNGGVGIVKGEIVHDRNEGAFNLIRYILEHAELQETMRE